MVYNGIKLGVCSLLYNQKWLFPPRRPEEEEKRNKDKEKLKSFLQNLNENGKIKRENYFEIFF